MGQMTNRGYANMAAETPVGALWGKACQALRHELGDDTFGSWLAQAVEREGSCGRRLFVRPTRRGGARRPRSW